MRCESCGHECERVDDCDRSDRGIYCPQCGRFEPDDEQAFRKSEQRELAAMNDVYERSLF